MEIVGGGASPPMGGGFSDRGGDSRGGDQKVFIFGPLRKSPPCNLKSPKNENFSPAARFYYISVLYFGSKSAPQAKILDFDTKKISEGGIS